jgi:hypothetical protein
VIQPTVTVDQRQLDAYLKRLDKNRGKPLQQRAERTLQAASQLVLVPAARREAPRGKGHYLIGRQSGAGNLQRRIRAKSLRRRAGEVIRPAWVGSAAYYSGMVQRGTKPHSLAPRAGKSRYAAFADGNVRALAGVTHPGSKPDPFMSRVGDDKRAEVVALMQRDTYDVR